MRRVENVVQGHRQLDRAQVGAQVTAGLARYPAKTAQLAVSSRNWPAAPAGCRIIDRRRSAGLLIVCIAGSETWVIGGCLHLSMGPVDDHVRQGTQGPGLRQTTALQRPVQAVQQVLRILLRSLQAQHRNIGGLVRRRPCRRSCPGWRSLRSRPGCRRQPGTPGRWPHHRSATGPATAPHRWAHRRHPSGRCPAARRRSCAGACHATAIRSGLAHAGQVDRLPAGHAGAARRARQQAAQARLGLCRDLVTSSGVSNSNARACSASPASRCAGLAELHMHGGFAAAQDIVVHAGHVVVDQGIRMDQLGGAGCTQLRQLAWPRTASQAASTSSGRRRLPPSSTA
jgi:hypothetical protein